MKTTVVCVNQDCEYYNVLRTVRLPHLGQGVYAKSFILACECGQDVVITPQDRD